MRAYYGERRQVVKAVDCDSTIRGFDPRRSPSSNDSILGWPSGWPDTYEVGACSRN